MLPKLLQHLPIDFGQGRKSVASLSEDLGDGGSFFLLFWCSLLREPVLSTPTPFSWILRLEKVAVSPSAHSPAAIVSLKWQRLHRRM